jgi:site-specific DNA recombinase
MHNPPLKVGIYLRISVEREADIGGKSATERQREDCERFAVSRGWEVAEVFEDADLSAFNKNIKRPAFGRMLESLKAGDIGAVLVWKLDRLSRQQRDLGLVLDACEVHKAFIASVTEPIDTRESYGQFVAELLVSQARMESANTSIRSRRKAQELRERGAPPINSRRAFGYTKDFSWVVPEEAALLGEARDRLFAGESLRGIAIDWDKRGVLSSEGNPFRAQVLKRLLLSATLSGQRENDGQLWPGQWPAIFTPDDTKRLRGLFEAKRTSPIGTTRKSLLAGLLRCGRCGQRLTSSRRNDGSRQYICKRVPGQSNCARCAIGADGLDDIVPELLFAAVDDEALRTSLASRGTGDSGLAELVLADEEALEELARDYYVERAISKNEFTAARRTLEARLESNRGKLARERSAGSARSLAGQGGSLRAAWPSASLHWRQAVIATVLDHVRIDPPTLKGRRSTFDIARVVPIWRY